MCQTQEELDEALLAVKALGDQWVIEELLEGEELSLFALVDGSNILPLPESRDYSRVGDGDTGPNTGGMGSYSPVPELDEGQVAGLAEAIHRPVVEEMAARGTPFIGCLYAGLMLTADGPRVLEFNCRFGDPETQTIMPRIEGDLAEALSGCRDRRSRRDRAGRLRACRRDRRPRRRGGIPRAVTPALRSRASRAPRPRARSSSMRAPRSGTGSS